MKSKCAERKSKIGDTTAPTLCNLMQYINLRESIVLFLGILPACSWDIHSTITVGHCRASITAGAATINSVKPDAKQPPLQKAKTLSNCIAGTGDLATQLGPVSLVS